MLKMIGCGALLLDVSFGVGLLVALRPIDSLVIGREQTPPPNVAGCGDVVQWGPSQKCSRLLLTTAGNSWAPARRLSRTH
jgi:hypothetical protein